MIIFVLVLFIKIDTFHINPILSCILYLYYYYLFNYLLAVFSLLYVLLMSVLFCI